MHPLSGYKVLTSGSEKWEPPWATRTHGNYFSKLMGWKALMAHLVVYMPSGNYNNWSIWSGNQLTPTSGKTMNNPSNKSPQWWYNLQLFILYHSGWSSIHQKLKLHGKWCWKVVMRHPWLKFNPFARKYLLQRERQRKKHLAHAIIFGMAGLLTKPFYHFIH